MFEAVVIGVSAGGMNALKTILSGLPASFPLCIIIVQHVSDTSDSYLSEFLNRVSAITVKEAESGEVLLPGIAYLAPPGYHLLVEPDYTLSLSVDARVNFSCPSIDVLFESAADTYADRLAGIILTGANGDGSKGLQKVKMRGGLAIVQNPKTAESFYMPQAALDAVKVDHIVDLEYIAPLLIKISQTSKRENHGTGTYN